MLTPRIPYHTIEALPEEELRKLKNEMTDFDKLGFASALRPTPAGYASLQLDYLQQLVKDEKLWTSYGEEISALFVKEYFLRTMLMAANENLWETLDISSFFVQFKNMQKIINEVFPYWIDNDYIYGLGKNMLVILKSARTEIRDEEQLKMLLNDVSILGLPPAVSIIMAVENDGEKLATALPKILNQTYENFELIIVDDGSTDNTGEVIKLFNDQRIRVETTESKKRRAGAYNLGIEKATYHYIAFASTDEIWEEKKLEIQMETLLNHPECGFCYGVYDFTDEEGQTILVPNRKIPLVRKEGYIYPELLRRNYIGIPAIVTKKEFIEIVGGFNEELEVFDDWEFALRLSKAYQAAFCPEILYEAFNNPDRTKGRSLLESKEEMNRFYDGFRKDRILFGMTDETF